MLNNLPKLTREEVKLINLVATCSSMANQALAWLPGIQEVLSKLVKTTCTLEFTRSSFESSPKITGGFLQITWPPKAGFIGIECDTKTLQHCAYQVIESTVPEDLDPKLSNLETGIIMHMLARVFESTKESFQFSDSQELPKTLTLCLSFKLTLGDLNSYVKLWISPELLTPIPAKSALELGKTRCMSAEIPLRIELGKVALTQEEFKNLEVGDIIILENSSLKSVDGFLGDPSYATLKGALSTNETTGFYSLFIQELL